MKEHLRLPVASHLFLIKEGKILLTRRANTGFADGMYGVPSGHIEENESASEALVREAFEEVDIKIALHDVEMVLAGHRAAGPLGGKAYIDFFFTAKEYSGTPTNAEPEKCDQIEWFEITHLPQNIIPYVAAAIRTYKDEKHFTEFGWDK